MKTAWIYLSVACLLAVTSPALAGTIADARAAGNGVVVTINGAVVGNTTDLINSQAVKSFHIQDATGGIAVFGGNAEIDALLGQCFEGCSEGDSIDLTGTTDSFSGVFELVAPFSGFVDNGPVGLVTPALITLTDMQNGSATAEGFESTLTRLNNVQFQNAGGTFVGSSNEIVENILMTSTGTVRIATTDLTIVGLTIPSGPVDIIGVFAQFDAANPGPGVAGNGYQLQPRSILDIISPGSPPVATAVKEIVPLNTASQNLTLSVADVDADPFDVIIESVPATGTIFDGAVQIGTLANPLPYLMSNPLNPVVTFFPAAADGTDMVIDYRGRQTTNGLSGPPGTASVLVQNDTVFITEVMYDPTGIITESQWEWVEVYNASAGTITLTELQSNTCPESTCGNDLIDTGLNNLVIGPGEIKVIVGTPSNFFGGSLRTDQDFLDKWGLTASQVFFPSTAFPFLSNGGNELFLSDDQGDLVDFVTNYGTVGFPANVDGLSINLDDPALDNDDGLNWSIAVISCAIGFKQASDGSVGSPGVVPTAASSTFTPCADSGDVNLIEVGAPSTKTITLTAALGPNAPVGATLSFEITATPFIFVNGFPEPVGTLHDGPTTAGAVLNVGSTVTDPGGQVTLEENSGKRAFVSFSFKAVEEVGGVPTGVESNVASHTVAIQGNTVVITEIMANPANTSGGSESYWEFIEVTNTGAGPVTLGSLQGTIGPATNDLNVDALANTTIPAGATRIFARDALDGTGIRTQAEFEAEWAAAGVSSANVIYVPNASGNSLWSDVSNNPAPNRFVTVWDNTNDFELTGLLDVVEYQNGQNGWPANTEPNSIFYRGDANGAPFTTLGNDAPANWQQSTLGCAGDGTIASFTDGGADLVADHGSPTILPTDPDQCVPTPCNTCLGDLSGPGGTPDSKVDALDIQAFIDIVVAPSIPAIGCADMNGDGDGLDYLPDVPLFVDALVNGSGVCGP